MKEHVADNRQRNHDDDIRQKHGDILLGTLRKIYGRTFAAGYQDSTSLGEVMTKLNETSLGQLRRDYETRHLDKKITKALA